MLDWTEGYIADIPYALGFYRETVPAHIAFAALCVGRHPSLSLKPERVLELGIGMGLGFVINAAANPATRFEGVDFNPQHVAHASGLIDAAKLDNVSVREASFQDLAREAFEGQHDIDLIVLHGILTWVSSEAHEAIVEVARKRLKPGGLLYVSYNAMPGWAPVLPMQRLMRENAKRVVGRSDMQTGSGLDLVKALIDEGAGYFTANNSLVPRFGKLFPMDRNYLAHEYLNANWYIFHFADVADMFARAKLTYVGSATLIENNDNLALPQGTRARIGAENDPIFRETLRDIASNKQFRRDLFGRGVSATTTAEQNALLWVSRFALAVPRSKVTFKIASPIGDLDANPEIYGALADHLAKGPATFGNLMAQPVLREAGAGSVLQALSLFVHSGQVLPIPATDPDLAPAHRLNRVIAEKVLQGKNYSFIAAPNAGSGLQVSNVDLMMLAAVHDGHAEDVTALARPLTAAMDQRGINWVSEGKPVTDQTAKFARAETEAKSFLGERLPLWRQLGAL